MTRGLEQWRRGMATKADQARALGVPFDIIEQLPAGTHCAECGVEKVGAGASVAGHAVCSPWCARQVLETIQAGLTFAPVAPSRSCDECGRTLPDDGGACVCTVAPATPGGCDDCERAYGPGAACRCFDWSEGQDDDDEPAEVERCSSCGVLGCPGTCEQGRDAEPACTWCPGGCIECGELGMRDDDRCPRCGGPVVWGAGPSCANGCDDEPADVAGADDALARLAVGARFEVRRRGWSSWVLVKVTHIDQVIPGAGTLFEDAPVRRLYVERVTEDGSRGTSWQHDERDAVRLVEVGLFE